MAKKETVTLEVDGREVTVSSPSKVYFPKHGYTKLDLVRYYVAVRAAAIRTVFNRPVVLRRFVDGVTGEDFYQKRAPASRPDFIETVTLSFPSGRTAEEVVLTHAAQLVWTVNLGCIEMHAHPVRADDVDHPDELRIDLDPVPGVPWSQIVDVAFVARESLTALGLVGFPKTSGSRGIHVYARIERRWGFDEVRRAALAVARDVERRAPELATSKWWKEERHGVFLDYNQNAKDRTIAAAWSVRPNEDAMVSKPLRWEHLSVADPKSFTLKTVPAIYEAEGDPWEPLDATPGSLDAALALAKGHEDEGLGDAPWPPHYAKQEGEPARVAPSRRKGARPTKAGAAKTAKKKGDGSGRRVPSAPLVVVAKAKKKDDALAGLDRWKERHPAAAKHLEPADVLVDSMRGRYSTWTRIRVNLKNVPEPERPAEEPPDPDYDPRRAV
jgi:DNA ligase D-like protein (predicted polymerase)